MPHRTFVPLTGDAECSALHYSPIYSQCSPRYLMAGRRSLHLSSPRCSTAPNARSRCSVPRMSTLWIILEAGFRDSFLLLSTLKGEKVGVRLARGCYRGTGCQAMKRPEHPSMHELNELGQAFSLMLMFLAYQTVKISPVPTVLLHGISPVGRITTICLSPGTTTMVSYFLWRWAYRPDNS